MGPGKWCGHPQVLHGVARRPVAWGFQRDVESSEGLAREDLGCHKQSSAGHRGVNVEGWDAGGEVERGSSACVVSEGNKDSIGN